MRFTQSGEFTRFELYGRAGVETKVLWEGPLPLSNSSFANDLSSAACSGWEDSCGLVQHGQIRGNLVLASHDFEIEIACSPLKRRHFLAPINRQMEKALRLDGASSSNLPSYSTGHHNILST